MKVGLVASCLNTPHIRGMGRYLQELLRQSASDTDLDWRLYGDDPCHPMAVPPAARATQDVFTFRGDRLHLWEQIGLPLHARRDGVDLLHCSEGSLPWWQPVPTVVTVHDTLAWEERGTGHAERAYFDRVLPAALHRCAAVITISDSSRRDIVARWPRLADKVVVIPHGIGVEYLDAGAEPVKGTLQLGLGEQPYLVYLGGPLPRKRFEWALEVLAHCGFPDLRLVACGFGAADRASRRAALPPALAPRVHFAEFMSDAELRALYGGAAAVLYPTLYEGFGFPAVEAQAAGVPVVFSAVSSLKDLIGPLALVAEPKDLAGWCGAVTQAQSLGPARAARAVEARHWASRFSWKRSFDRHRDVYRQVAGGA